MSSPDDGQAEVPTATGAATSRNESEYTRIAHWRNATRDLVLTGASAIVTSDQPGSGGIVSFVLTGTALENDLLLADSGKIALTLGAGPADAHSHPMRVVPMRLDILSDLPALRVEGFDLTEPTQLRLAVKLIAQNAHTDAMSVMTCDYESVRLDARMSVALLRFEPQHCESQL